MGRALSIPNFDWLNRLLKQVYNTKIIISHLILIDLSS